MTKGKTYKNGNDLLGGKTCSWFANVMLKYHDWAVSFHHHRND